MSSELFQLLNHSPNLFCSRMGEGGGGEGEERGEEEDNDDDDNDNNKKKQKKLPLGAKQADSPGATAIMYICQCPETEYPFSLPCSFLYSIGKKILLSDVPHVACHS